MPPVLLELPSTAPFEVTVERNVRDGDDYLLRLPDRSLSITCRSRASDRGFLLIDHAIHRYCILRRNDHVEVWLGGRLYRVRIARRNAAARAGHADHAPPAGDILATMPGTIIRIEVADGDAFAAHQPLIIMESMKMELTLSSPQPGRVQKIACQPGQLVDIGALLIRVEPQNS